MYRVSEPNEVGFGLAVVCAKLGLTIGLGPLGAAVIVGDNAPIGDSCCPIATEPPEVGARELGLTIRPGSAGIVGDNAPKGGPWSPAAKLNCCNNNNC